MGSIVRIALPALLIGVPSNSLACEFDGIGGHRFMAFSSAYVPPADRVPAEYVDATQPAPPSSQSNAQPQQDAPAPKPTPAPAAPSGTK